MELTCQSYEKIHREVVSDKHHVMPTSGTNGLGSWLEVLINTASSVLEVSKDGFLGRKSTSRTGLGSYGYGMITLPSILIEECTDEADDSPSVLQWWCRNLIPFGHH